MEDQISSDSGDGNEHNDSERLVSNNGKCGRPAPPRLVFDDGSRVMITTTTTTTTPKLVTLNSTKDPSSMGVKAHENNDARVDLNEAYEITRMVNELICLIQHKKEQRQILRQAVSANCASTGNNRLLSLQVAVQFPDELLHDAADVCWALEESLEERLLLQRQHQSTSGAAEYPEDDILDLLVFCLGDTTFAPCCSDIVAAQHLQADVLIHYGHACFFHHHHPDSASMPILYSFGKASFDVQSCVDAVLQQMRHHNNNNKREDSKSNVSFALPRRVLLLYDLPYHAVVMEDLQTQLSECGDLLVVAGRIPQSDSGSWIESAEPMVSSPSATYPATCCGSSSDADRSSGDAMCGCSINTPITGGASTLPSTPRQQQDDDAAMAAVTCADPPLASTMVYHPVHLKLGGLEIPAGVVDWSDWIVLYIGNDDDDTNKHHPTLTTSSSSRQYLNVVLRYLSEPTHDNDDNPTQRQQQRRRHFWTWNPRQGRLMTDFSPNMMRRLSRRFYYMQKARHASIFGIVIAHSSTSSSSGGSNNNKLGSNHTIQVVTSLQQLIHQHNRSCYTISLGKISPSKLANFAEIECFVLVSCPEHALLQEETSGSGIENQYAVPVLTPLELSMALGVTEWGHVPYSLDSHDYLRWVQGATTTHTEQNAVNHSAVLGAKDTAIDDFDQDDDVPFFSVITGRYESKPRRADSLEPQDTHQHPQLLSSSLSLLSLAAKDSDVTALTPYGGNQLSAPVSQLGPMPASNFFKQRRYQGLEVLVGKTPVQAAVPGQEGIASGYQHEPLEIPP